MKVIFKIAIIIIFCFKAITLLAQDNQELNISSSYPDDDPDIVPKLNPVNFNTPVKKTIRVGKNQTIIPQLITRYPNNGICFSPDGNYIARADGRVVGIWDANTGRLVKTILTNYTESVVFTRDGKQLLTGSDRIKVFDVQSGKLVRTIPEKKGRYSDYGQITEIKLNRDESLIFIVKAPSSFYDSVTELAMWDYKTGNKLWDAGPVMGEIYSVDFDFGGKNLLISMWGQFFDEGYIDEDNVGEEYIIGKFDALTGKLLYRVDFDDDSYDKRVYYRPIYDNIIYQSEEYGICMVNNKMDNIIKTINPGNTKQLNPLIFSDNGETMLTGSGIFTGENLEKLKLQKNNNLESWDYNYNRPYGEVLDPAGKKLFVNSENPYIYDIEKQKKIAALKAQFINTEIKEIVVSSDGKEFIIQRDRDNDFANEYFEIWNVKNGIPNKALDFKNEFDGSYKLYCKDNSFKILGDGGNLNYDKNKRVYELNIWDIATGGIEFNIRPWYYYGDSINFINKGDGLLIFNTNHTEIEIGNFEDYNIIFHTIDIKNTQYVKNEQYPIKNYSDSEWFSIVYGSTFISESNLLALSVYYRPGFYAPNLISYTQIWDKNKPFKLTFLNKETIAEPRGINKEGTLLVCKSQKNADENIVFSLKRNSPIATITGCQTCLFSHDGKYLVGCNPDAIFNETDKRMGMIYIWETKGWKQKHILPGHNGSLEKGVISQDNILLTTGGNCIKMWDIEKGVLLRTIYPLDTGSFISYTPDGEIYSNTDIDDFLYVADKSLPNIGTPVLDKVKSGTINVNHLRIRAFPELNAEIRGVLMKNDRVKVHKQSTEKTKIDDMNDYWYLVETHEGITGWSYGYYIDIAGE